MNENYKGFSVSKSEVKSFEGTERELLIHKIQYLNCPKCSKKKDRLYGFVTNQVISVFLFSNHTRSEQILSLNCGIKEKIRTILITLFAGWWSKRWFLLIPRIVVKDLINFFFINKVSEKTINLFIDEKTGFFRRKGIENETLKVVINSRNVEHIPPS